jgi:hypothetical protein
LGDAKCGCRDTDFAPDDSRGTMSKSTSHRELRGKMDDVVVKYHLSWPEYRSMQWKGAPKRNFVLVLAIWVLSAIVAVAGGDIEWTIAAIIFGGGLPSLLFWIGPRMHWSNSLDIKDPRTTTVGDQGISIRSTAHEFRLGWSQIESVRENDRYFVVIQVKGNGALFIPKRGLSSSDDETRLRNFLQRRGGSLTQS